MNHERKVNNEIINSTTNNVVDGGEALATARKNIYRAFNYSERCESNAGNRIASGLPIELGFKPKFTLPKTSKIFTFGSCFARNIEYKLKDIGVRLTHEGLKIDNRLLNKSHRGFKELIDLSMNQTEALARLANTTVNKYNVSSMLDELKRVEQGSKSYQKMEGVVQYSNKWFDPLVKNLNLNCIEDVVSVRESLSAYYLTMTQADVVMITLGLTEVWIDTHENVICNITPPGQLIKNEPQRYKFVRLDFDSCRQTLIEIVHSIKRILGDDAKLIMTVSPIPLSTTFSKDDVIVANCYSKAVLRAVVQEIVEQYSFVDYFPSYEIVSFTTRDIAYRSDQIHVTEHVISHIMDVFSRSYFEA